MKPIRQNAGLYAKKEGKADYSPPTRLQFLLFQIFLCFQNRSLYLLMRNTKPLLHPKDAPALQVISEGMTVWHACLDDLICKNIIWIVHGVLDNFDSIQDGYHWDWFRCSFKDTNQKSELANQTSYFEMGFTQEEVLTKFHHCHVYSLCINWFGRIVLVNNVKTNGKMDRGL